MSTAARDALDDKVNQVFAGKCVRKDLVRAVKVGANVPVFVLEYLLGKYCASSDSAAIELGLTVVRDTLAGQPSILLRREINVTAAILAATLYIVLRMPETPIWPAAIVAAVAGFMLRAGALRWGWTLPGFPARN